MLKIEFKETSLWNLYERGEKLLSGPSRFFFKGLDDPSHLNLGLSPELAVHHTCLREVLRKAFCCQLESVEGKIRVAVLQFLQGSSPPLLLVPPFSSTFDTFFNTFSIQKYSGEIVLTVICFIEWRFSTSPFYEFQKALSHLLPMHA